MNKRLEEENQSYITALNILQVDELQCDIQKSGQSATIYMQNNKLQPKQLEILRQRFVLSTEAEG